MTMENQIPVNISTNFIVTGSKTDINKEACIPGLAGDQPSVPKKQDYFFDYDELQAFLTWYMEGGIDPLYMFSDEPSSGKTQMVYQFFSRLNIPVYRLDVNADTTIELLEGKLALRGNETVFEYGPLPLALGATGHPGVLLINEMHKGDPEVWSGLHDVLDGNPHVLLSKGYETHTPAYPFRVIGTGNTTLLQADKGNHPGSYIQDTALVDRFWVMEKQYPDIDTRKRIVLNAVPDLNTELGHSYVDRMVAVQETIRRQYKGLDSDSNLPRLDTTMTIRALVRWAKISVSYSGMAQQFQKAIELAFTATLSDTTQQGIMNILEAHFGSAARSKQAASTSYQAQQVSAA
jgi:cobaltochelatase CobS